MRGYPSGTEIQEKSGRVKKKLPTGQWMSRGRYIWMKENKESLTENQRVFHKDGDKRNDDPENLVPITFSGVRYELSHSRVLWIPKNQPGLKKVIQPVKRTLVAA